MHICIFRRTVFNDQKSKFLYIYDWFVDFLFECMIELYIYIYLKQTCTGSHKWQNLIGSENLKFLVIASMEQWSSSPKWFWLYFVKVLSFPKTSWMSEETAKLIHDRATFVRHIPVILKLIFILSFLYANYCVVHIHNLKTKCFTSYWSSDIHYGYS